MVRRSCDDEQCCSLLLRLPQLEGQVYSASVTPMDVAEGVSICNDQKSAMQIFDQLLEKHGSDKDWLIGRANSLVAVGRMSDALAAYTHAFQVGKVLPEDLHDLVDALLVSMLQLEELQLSIAMCRTAIREQPTDVLTCMLCHCLIYEPTTLLCGHTQCRRCLINSTNCPKCKVKPNLSISSPLPSVNVVLNGLLEKYFTKETHMRQLRLEGNELYENGNLQEAVEKYTQAYELVPNDHYLLSNRSCVYIELSHYSEALDDAEMICQLQPGWLKGYYRKAIALIHLQQFEKAMIALFQSFILDPTSTVVRESLTQVLHKLLFSQELEEPVNCLKAEPGLVHHQSAANNPTVPRRFTLDVADISREVAHGFRFGSRCPDDASGENADQEDMDRMEGWKQLNDCSEMNDGASSATPTSSTSGINIAKMTADSSISKTTKVPTSQGTNTYPIAGVTRDISLCKTPKATNITSSHSAKTSASLLSGLSGVSSVSGASDISTAVSLADSLPLALSPGSGQGSGIVLKERRHIPRGMIDKHDYECSLCYRLFLEPVTTRCGHTFCRLCLHRCLDYGRMCPLCKSTLSDHLTVSKRSVDELLLHLMVTNLGEEYRKREEQLQAELNAMSIHISDQTQCEVPIFVCTLAFPTIQCPLHIYEPRYRLMIRQIMDSGARQFGMCLPLPNSPDRYAVTVVACRYEEIGCMLEVQQVQNLPDGRSVIKTIGGRRFKVRSTGRRDGYDTALVEFIKDAKVTGEEIAVIRALETKVYEHAKAWFLTLPIFHQTRIIAHFGPTPAIEDDSLSLPQGPPWTWWLLAVLPLSKQIQKRIMAEPGLKNRLVALQHYLQRITNCRF